MASKVMSSQVEAGPVGHHQDIQLLELGLQIYQSEQELSLWQSVKVHKRIVLYCSAAFMIGAVYGYDNICNGATIAMPSFLLYFGETTPSGELILPSLWTSLWTAMSGLGQAIGGFGIGFVMDRFGRKYTAVAIAAFSMAGVALQYTSASRGQLLAGKLVNSAAIGAMFALGTAWASEICPTKLRGPIQSALILFLTAMQMLGLGVLRSLLGETRPRGFRLAFMVQWPLAAAVFLLFFLVPESPTFLVNRGRHEAAKNALARLYGKDNSIDARFTHLLDVIRHENHGKEVEAGGYFDCFRGSDLRRTLIVIYVLLGLNVCGAQLLTQNIYFLIVIGLPVVHVFDINIGGFAFALCLIFSSWFFLDKVGRRAIFLAGPLISATFLYLVGGLYYVSGQGPKWAIAILFNLLISWGALTFISTAWAIVAEVSSHRLRAKSQAIGVIINAFTAWLFAFITPYMYNVDSGNLGARTGFVYGGFATLYLIGCYFWVPETAGLSVAEVDWIFEQKTPLRQFQSVKEQAKAASGQEIKQEAIHLENMVEE